MRRTHKTATVSRTKIPNGADVAPSLPAPIDLFTLSMALGFRNKIVAYFVTHMMAVYNIFVIPKKNGKQRVIHAPKPGLKRLQKRIRQRFLLPLIAKLGAHVTAYRHKKNILAAVKQHVADCAVCAPYDVHTCKQELNAAGRAVTVGDCVACTRKPRHECPRRNTKIKLDLSDFFHSTRRKWVKGYLAKLGYNKMVSTSLATLMTANIKDKYWGVPQGAPTSGDICNLIAADRMDPALLAYCAENGMTYTRYADDLCFNFKTKVDGPAARVHVNKLIELIGASGYRVNRKKIKILQPRHKQRILGIVINEKINVDLSKYRTLRAIVNNCRKNGIEAEAIKSKVPVLFFIQSITGALNYYNSLAPKKIGALKLVFDATKAKYKESCDAADTNSTTIHNPGGNGTARGAEGTDVVRVPVP